MEPPKRSRKTKKSDGIETTSPKSKAKSKRPDSDSQSNAVAKLGASTLEREGGDVSTAAGCNNFNIYMRAEKRIRDVCPH